MVYRPSDEESVKESRGILKKIVRYIFIHTGESVPGSTRDKNEVMTTLLIEDKGLEYALEFNGFIGGELVGREVLYEEKITTTTELFNQKGRENDPAYREGRKEINITRKLGPVDGKTPSYTYMSHYQHSI